VFVGYSPGDLIGVAVAIIIVDVTVGIGVVTEGVATVVEAGKKFMSVSMFPCE
jgi:hypothetical protein